MQSFPGSEQEQETQRKGATQLNEELVLECSGEAHLGDVDTLLLRGRDLQSLAGLDALNLPALQARCSPFLTSLTTPC